MRGQRVRAFTLLETVVATVIFSTAVVTLALLFSGAHRGTARSLQQLCANSLAQRLVEEAVDGGQNGIVPRTSSGTVALTSIRRGAEATTNYAYQVEVDTHAPRLYDVVVRVRWTYQDKESEILREVLVSPRS